MSGQIFISYRREDSSAHLKLLARRNALELSHNRFKTDSESLMTVIERALEQVGASKRPSEKRLPGRFEDSEEITTLDELQSTFHFPKFCK
jgi:hypothetical protein